MEIVPLTIKSKGALVFPVKGGFCLIDPADLPTVSQYKWHLERWRDRDKYYVASTVDCPDGKKRTLRMHRLLAGSPGRMVDHWNGNGLDNRRCNLRVATGTQNGANRSKSPKQRCHSQYKGVSWNKGRWVANIKMNGQQIGLGRFRAEEDAARAYNEAARRLFGEFAKLNEVGPGNSLPDTRKTSRFRGVSWNRVRGNWRAHIFRHGKDYRLGEFATEEEAAEAYKWAAERLGVSSRLNYAP